ncbi:MAG: hypothetical protein JKY70_14880 [Mucilaginibacter sp.]|nr:hypothetical protein [Mucilaginibacter sp.]
MVIKANKTELFDIVENAISDRMAATLFPIEKYKGYSILAIINSHNGNLVKAKEYAALAEENAKATTSGLRYHQYLGIVKEEDKWLDRLISKIKK